MMRLHLILSAFLLTFVTSVSTAQHFEVPSDYSFDTKEGYHKYDNDIIKCINWLEKTPVKESNGKIKRAGEFLTEWLTGCPYVHFTEYVRIDASLSNSPQLKLYYMGGWARYAIENPGKTDKVKCCVAGIRCALKVYRNNKSLERDQNMDEIAGVENEGKLDEWVKDHM